MTTDNYCLNKSFILRKNVGHGEFDGSELPAANTTVLLANSDANTILFSCCSMLQGDKEPT